MKIKDISQPLKLTLTGFALPYLVIIISALMVISQPETTDVKWIKAGLIPFVLPSITAFIGALLVGVGSVKKQITKTGKKSLIQAFLFGFVWTGIFHFFITMYIFMQIVYTSLGGMKH